MSAWGRSLWGAGRFSPFSAAPSAYPPQVNDEDYSYITADDMATPPHSYDQPRASKVSLRPSADDDIIRLKIGGSLHPVYFNPYSIDDGLLTVADLLHRAAEVAGVADHRSIRLLYKGRHLKDENRLCRDEGLKIDSEVLCVVPDNVPADDDESESEGGNSSAGGSGDGTAKRKGRRRKKKGKKAGSGLSSNNGPHLVPPESHRSGTSRSSSPAPPPSPCTPREKLEQISSNFNTTLLPQCVQFTSHPPSDQSKREFEHKRLTETILSQVLLKLDAVETEGDSEVRQRRKDLVKETQGVLNGLDAVMKM